MYANVDGVMWFNEDVLTVCLPPSTGYPGFTDNYFTCVDNTAVPGMGSLLSDIELCQVLVFLNCAKLIAPYNLISTLLMPSLCLPFDQHGQQLLI
jgi:hypothetical protein